ncbi:Uncharacterised protein [Serratia quinivorans]|uniref:hypothetical protein n=1 Tax=Serratia quinivorans TaxID=137545 RepID=UPI002179EBAD|nr:hypothetical protein [Serratia quinivorans]CAI1874311.1 Uncharacterised protein [Serratia quinivorans]CAI1899927.1 Uncharacterised protein [Serratia quinivorans]
MKLSPILLLSLFGTLSIFSFGPVAAALRDCQVNLSEGVIDYGEFTFHSLPDQGNSKSFGTRQVELQVNCPEPENILLKLQSPMTQGGNVIKTRHGGIIGIVINKVHSDTRGTHFSMINTTDQHASAWQTSPMTWVPGKILLPQSDNNMGSKQLSVFLTISLDVDRQAPKANAAQVLDGEMLFSLVE